MVAALHLAFPVAYLLTIALFFNVPVAKIVTLILSPGFYFVCFWAVLAGYGLKEMHRWSWYVFLISNAVILYENAFVVTNYSESNYKIIVFFFCILIQAVMVYQVSAEVRVPYFLPRIRWWENDPRYKVGVPVKVTDDAERIVNGEILDISVGGCFIKSKEDFKRDERVSLQFDIIGQVISCKGNVVWRTESTVTHPKGIGVKFASETITQKKRLKVIMRRLKKMSLEDRFALFTGAGK